MKSRDCVGGGHDWRSPVQTHQAWSPDHGATVIETHWCAVCGLLRVRTWKNRCLEKECYEEDIPDWDALAERARHDHVAWKLLCSYSYVYTHAALKLLELIRDHARELRRHERRGDGLVYVVDAIVNGVAGIDERLARMNKVDRIYGHDGLVEAARAAAKDADEAYDQFPTSTE